MLILKECVGKGKSHRSTVSPRRDKARIVRANGQIASFLTKEYLISCPNDLSSPLLSPLIFFFLLRGEEGEILPSVLPCLSLFRWL